MQQRVIAVAALCFLVGCSESTPFEYDSSARPSEAGSGEVVAKVLLLSGRVTIKTTGGFAFPAAPGVPLIETDEIAVAEKSFVVLQLRNNHLSRIDSNVTLAVADLAMIDAPATRVSIQQQLTRVLTPQERDDSGRIVGWHARLSAAQSVPAQRQETKAEEEAIAMAAPVPAEAKKKKPAVKRRRPAPRAAPPPSSKAARASARPPADLDELGSIGDIVGSGESTGGAGLGGLALKGKTAVEAKLRPRVVRWLEKVGTEWKVQKGAKPASLLRLVRRPDFVDCLRKMLARDESLERIRFEIDLEGGKIVRIRVLGNPPLAGCIKARLLRRPVVKDLGDGSFRLEVALR